MIDIQQLIEDLRGARDLIAEHGLARFVYRDHETGCFCSVGALSQAATGTPSHYDAGRVNAGVVALLETLLGPEVIKAVDAQPAPLRSMLFHYNDYGAGSKDRVLDLFTRTVNRLELGNA